MIDFSFLSDGDYEEQPIFGLHQLAFEKGVDRGGSEDVRFDYRFNGMDYWDFTNGLTEEQEEVFADWFDPSGHKIGGIQILHKETRGRMIPDATKISSFCR